jgi:hypothetical protein
VGGVSDKRQQLVDMRERLIGNLGEKIEGGDLALLLFLTDVAPQLVQLQAIDLDKPHHLVMQRGAAFANADAKAHDRITVNAGQPLGSTD